MNADEKQCPYCAETIKAIAVKCKHCHSELNVKSEKDSVKEVILKPCPFCAEDIDIKNEKCPHCESVIKILLHGYPGTSLTNGNGFDVEIRNPTIAQFSELIDKRVIVDLTGCKEDLIQIEKIDNNNFKVNIFHDSEMKNGNLKRDELIRIARSYISYEKLWANNPKLEEVIVEDSWKSLPTIAKAGYDLMVSERDQQRIKYLLYVLIFLVLIYIVSR